MTRSKLSKSNAAEKALQQAIAQETAELQAVIRAREADIVRLHRVIAQIGNIVASVPKAAEPVKVAAPPPPLPPEPDDEPQEPAPEAELSGADNMGPGRWA